MLFLSPGIVYWVQTLLHWCDSNSGDSRMKKVGEATAGPRKK